MADNPTVKVDQGAVNARILAREVKVDFRRVEAASLKMRTRLTSAEAKRLFVRMFNTLQLNTHFIQVIARTRVDHPEVERIEAELRAQIDAVKEKLGEAIDEAEALFKAHGVSSYATYDTQPLEIDVGILSSCGRRYLEALSQFDQLMPLLQTLEIHEIITTQALDLRRAVLKRQLKNVATSARRLATGLRRRMNAMATHVNEGTGQRLRETMPDRALTGALTSAPTQGPGETPGRAETDAAAGDAADATDVGGTPASDERFELLSATDPLDESASDVDQRQDPVELHQASNELHFSVDGQPRR